MTATTTIPLDIPSTTNAAVGDRRTVRWLAAIVVTQPALLALNSMFHPEVDLTGSSLLAATLESPTTWYVVHMIAALGALLGPAAAYGIRTLVPARGRSLATTGLLLTTIGATLLACGFVLEAGVLHLAAADLPAAAAVAVADAYASRPEFYAVGIGAAVATLGALLLGGALGRSRSVPRWQPLVYIAGVVATMLGAPGTIVGPLGFVIVTVVSAFLAAAMTKTGLQDHPRTDVLPLGSRTPR